MSSIMQTTISNYILFKEDLRIVIQISLKFVPNGPINTIDNKSSVVQVMAWCLFRDKPLAKPMVNQFTNAIWHNWDTMTGLDIKGCPLVKSNLIWPPHNLNW